MEAYELKQYIIENNKIEFILESIGCHGIKEYPNEFRCALPNSDNSSKVSIKKETLKITIFDTSWLHGDIFTLVMNAMNLNFAEANKKVHVLLGLKYIWKPQEKKENPLDIFLNASRQSIDVNNVELYDEEILEDFLPYPHKSWIQEGIMPSTCDVFDIGYSHKHRRIIIPHRYWCGEHNKYMGIMGRTTIQKYEMLDIPKYYPIIKFSKGSNIYGLQENYSHIQEAGYIVVCESEKSVLKRHSKGDRTLGAICGSNITDEQVKILIGLDVEIVLAFDKGIPIEHVLKECNKFKHIRKVSYIWDEFNILKDKEAPMDKPDKIYKYLFNHRMVA